jgi:hypothetical protein
MCVLWGTNWVYIPGRHSHSHRRESLKSYGVRYCLNNSTRANGKYSSYGGQPERFPVCTGHHKRDNDFHTIKCPRMNECKLGDRGGEVAASETAVPPSNMEHIRARNCECSESKPGLAKLADWQRLAAQCYMSASNLRRCSSTSPTGSFNVRFEVYTAVTVKNAVFWDIKTEFVPHRGHITSPLQRPAS